MWLLKNSVPFPCSCSVDKQSSIGVAPFGYLLTSSILQFPFLPCRKVAQQVLFIYTVFGLTVERLVKKKKSPRLVHPYGVLEPSMVKSYRPSKRGFSYRTLWPAVDRIWQRGCRSAELSLPSGRLFHFFWREGILVPTVRPSGTGGIYDVLRRVTLPCAGPFCLENPTLKNSRYRFGRLIISYLMCIHF